jgi:hypothetical protein
MNVVNIGGIEMAMCETWAMYRCSRDGKIIMSPNCKILKQGVHGAGYMKVAKIGFDKKGQYVHRMVADAWLGKCPEGMEVNHKDHCKSNNSVDNLEYITHSENIIKARAAGRFPDMKGKNHWMFGKVTSLETRQRQSAAKLGGKHWRAVRPDVERIKALRATGLTDAAIADNLGLKRTVVGDVLRGTHWSVRTEYVDRQFPAGREAVA